MDLFKPAAASAGWLAVSVLALVACGGSAPGKGLPTASPMAIQLDDLYQDLIGANAAARNSRLAVVRSMTLNEFYQRTLVGLNDAAFTIDGTEVRGLATHFKGLTEVFATLDGQYASIGALWSAVGYEPRATVSQAQFRAMNQDLLEQLRQGSSALALASNAGGENGDAFPVQAYMMHPDCPTVQLSDPPTGRYGGAIEPSTGAMQAAGVDALLATQGFGKKGSCSAKILDTTFTRVDDVTGVAAWNINSPKAGSTWVGYERANGYSTSGWSMVHTPSASN